MDKVNSQVFYLSTNVLRFDLLKRTLLCQSNDGNKNIWIKKIEVDVIHTIIEDENNYYCSCGSDDKNGLFIAINRFNGDTNWYIPGRAFFHILFKKYLFVIFIDEKEFYYLIKVQPEDGSKLWHYEVDKDLQEYSFKNDRIRLSYKSGKVEKISPITGAKIY